MSNFKWSVDALYNHFIECAEQDKRRGYTIAPIRAAEMYAMNMFVAYGPTGKKRKILMDVVRKLRVEIYGTKENFIQDGLSGKIKVFEFLKSRGASVEKNLEEQLVDGRYAEFLSRDWDNPSMEKNFMVLRKKRSGNEDGKSKN